jgi:hypothetical protein
MIFDNTLPYDDRNYGWKSSQRWRTFWLCIREFGEGIKG